MYNTENLYYRIYPDKTEPINNKPFLINMFKSIPAFWRIIWSSFNVISIIEATNDT
jgi:hypothetical protein